MKKHLNTLIIATVCGMVSILGFVLRNKEVDLFSIIYFKSANGCEGYFYELPSLVEMLIPLLFFCVIYGIHVYKHFCSGSVYYFSRNSNRVLWFLKETVYLMIISVIYIFVMALSSIIIVLLFSKININSNDLIYLLKYIIIQSFFISTSALLINLISICSSSNIGFAIVVGIIMFFVVLYSMSTEVFNCKPELIIIINPIYHLILRSTFYYSIMYFSFILILEIIAGIIIVKNHRFINHNLEIGA